MISRKLLLYLAIAIVLSIVFAGCDSIGRRIATAERAFDSGNFEKAQFAYFELLNTTNDAAKERVVDSLFPRLKKTVTNASFAPSSYAEWSALLDGIPEKSEELDRVFAESITSRAEKLLGEGNTVDSAVLLGYLPENADDKGLMKRITELHEKKQVEAYNAGLDKYKSFDYDGAIEEWGKLDPSSECAKKASEIKARIPAEKEKHLFAEARKRKVEGIAITSHDTASIAVFNRIAGQKLKSETAPEGKVFLRITAKITKSIDLFAWYVKDGKYKQAGCFRRELVWLPEDPEQVKRMYKQVISPDNPMEVIYFLPVDYDFTKLHAVYISPDGAPFAPDDLADTAILLEY